MIPKLRAEGTEIWFTDGSRQEEQAGCAAVMEEGESRTRRLGGYSTVCDAELEGIAMALEGAQTGNTLILADSQAAICIYAKITGGKPLRTAAERRIAVAAKRHKRNGNTTKIGWVKTHDRITGNELADAAAKRVSEEPGMVQVVIAGGLRQKISAERKEWREKQSFGEWRSIGWDRKAMSKYT